MSDNEDLLGSARSDSEYNEYEETRSSKYIRIAKKVYLITKKVSYKSYKNIKRTFTECLGSEYIDRDSYVSVKYYMDEDDRYNFGNDSDHFRNTAVLDTSDQENESEDEFPDNEINDNDSDNSDPDKIQLDFITDDPLSVYSQTTEPVDKLQLDRSKIMHNPFILS